MTERNVWLKGDVASFANVTQKSRINEQNGHKQIIVTILVNLQSSVLFCICFLSSKNFLNQTLQYLYPS